MADDMKDRIVKCRYCKAEFAGPENAEQAFELRLRHEDVMHRQSGTPSLEGLTQMTRRPVEFTITGRALNSGESSVWQRLPKAIGVLIDAGFEVTLVEVEVYREESR